MRWKKLCDIIILQFVGYALVGGVGVGEGGVQWDLEFDYMWVYPSTHLTDFFLYVFSCKRYFLIKSSLFH